MTEVDPPPKWVPYYDDDGTSRVGLKSNVDPDVAGSGLPDPWTSDQTTGEVVATVNDPALTPLAIVGLPDQDGQLLVLTFDTDPGTADVLVIRQSVAKGGIEILTVDDSGEFDFRLVDPGADCITVRDNSDPTTSEGRMLYVSAAAQVRHQIVEFQDTTNGATLRFGGLDQDLQLANDLTPGDVTFDLQGTLRALVAVISNAHTEPPDGDLNNSDHVSWLDDTPGAVVLHFKAKDSAGTVVRGSMALT